MQPFLVTREHNVQSLKRATPSPQRFVHSLCARMVGCLLASVTLSDRLALAETASASASDTDSALQEVVVTANKRAEDTREVPISIGVMGGQEILDLHVDNTEDIARMVPGVSFAAHTNGPNGPGQDNISIRGVSSTFGYPTVGTYIAEVPITTITGYEGVADPRLLDIDRVEVLRGPQGTLYGASSEGGTIRFITNQPDSHIFSGSFRQEVSGTVHGGFNFDDRGVMNIPVVVMTSSEDVEDKQRCEMLDVECYITKPVDLEKFLVVVKKLKRHWQADVILPALS